MNQDMFFNYVYTQQPSYMMELSLYASLHFQISGIQTVMSSKSARVSDFSPHVTFEVK